MNIQRFTPAELYNDPDGFAGYEGTDRCSRDARPYHEHEWFDFDDETGLLVGCSVAPDRGAPHREAKAARQADLEAGSPLRHANTTYLGKHGPLAEIRSAFMMGA